MIKMSTIEIIMLVWPPLSVLIGFYVKDALFKRDLQHKDNTIDTKITQIQKDLEKEIESVQKQIGTQDKLNASQETFIQRNREGILTMRENMLNLEKKLDQHQSIQHQEIKELKNTQIEMTKALTQLEATMKGLGQLIELKIK